MHIQEYRKHEYLEGLCPVGIDLVKEIGLTPLEKKAIFLSLKRHIDKFKEAMLTE